VDNRGNSHSSMDARAGDRIYDGLLHSYTAGRCHHCGAGQGHSRAETPLEAILSAISCGIFYKEF
jgi:hypothetical protein